MDGPVDGLSFWVPGVPAPQGSKRVGRNRRTGAPVLIESAGERLRDWRNVTASYARVAQGGAASLTGPVAVRLSFWMPRPRSPKCAERPCVRPDVDKLCRAVLDSLGSAGAYVDDGQVVELSASKWWAGPEGPGVRVVVQRLSVENVAGAAGRRAGFDGE